MTEEKKVLIKARKLKKYFPIAKGVKLKAVEDVSFQIYEGEKFGVVGESGCGKSTLGRTILQLYPQTSGSCVYFGKSIQELDPKYIKYEIEHLKEYQDRASAFYQKSLTYDSKVTELYSQRSQLDSDGNASDAKRYDAISKEIAKLEFKSKELKKNASRQLREGSRTVGSLILCRDIDKVASLFLKALAEIKSAHDVLMKYNDIKNKYDENEVIIAQKTMIPKMIDILENKERNEDEVYQLADLIAQRKKIESIDIESLKRENEKLAPELSKLKSRIEDHRQKELAYKKEAFKYRDQDILDITERCADEVYRRKLDENYETGINLSKLTKKEMRIVRRDMQMIFQDPAASLDPRQSIGKAIEEVFKINTDMSAKVRKEKTMQLLVKVGLKREHYYSYPHSLSGGQKQRVGIARAIALDPSFIVLDEAVSALDVSVQAQILKLLNELSEEKHLTYFFITHDLGVVKHFADRIMVMYLGSVCELAPSKELFAHHFHPYTESLLDSVPRLTLKKDREAKDETVLEGEVPSAMNPPSGCPFHTRCKKCMDICKIKRPKYQEVRPGHFVACHLYKKEDEDVV